MAESRADTVSGTVTATDPDGIDSVWVTVGSDQRADDGGFNQTFSSRYRFPLPTGAGQQPGTRIPMTFRVRDVAAFETQRDTYVVVVP